MYKHIVETEREKILRTFMTVVRFLTEFYIYMIYVTYVICSDKSCPHASRKKSLECKKKKNVSFYGTSSDGNTF